LTIDGTRSATIVPSREYINIENSAETTTSSHYNEIPN
jgi:hypothetical protein